MGLTKNSFIKLNDTSVAYATDGVQGQFTISNLSSDIPGVYSNDQRVPDTVVKVPLDLIVFGRVGFDPYNWNNFWNGNQSANFAVGVNREYLSALPSFNTSDFLKARPPIITGSRGPDFFGIKSPSSPVHPPIGEVDVWGDEEWEFHNTTAWGFLESITLFQYNKLVKDIQIICLTSRIKELQREIIQDKTTGHIHYITLVQYDFKSVGKIKTSNSTNDGTITQNFNDSVFRINVLLDFVYSESQLYGIEILNNNIQIEKVRTYWDPKIYVPTQLNHFAGPWILQRNFGMYPWITNDGEYKIVGSDTVPATRRHVDQNLYVDPKNSYNAIMPSEHNLYHPSTYSNNSIASFTVMNESNGVSIIYTYGGYSYGRNQFYFKYVNTGTPNTIDWKTNCGERTYWIPESRNPALRTLSTGFNLPKIWGLNPSGSINSSNGLAFPIVQGDIQSYNSKDTSTAILANEDESCKYYISYVPGAAINVYATNFPGSIGSVGTCTGNFRQQTRELPIAGITYTDSMSSTYYTAYILTQQNLFMATMYSDDVSKVNVYNRTIDCRTINGIYSKGPIADSIYINYTDAFLSIVRSKRVDMTAFVPLSVILTAELDDGKSVYYNLKLAFRTTESAKAACTNLYSNNNIWSVRVADPIIGDIITLDIGNSKQVDKDVYIRLNLNSYLMSHKLLVLSNVTLYITGIDETLPYVISCVGSVDTRELQLEDVKLKVFYQGVETDYGILSSGLYSSGVIPMTYDQINNSTFMIGCTGLTNNILKYGFEYANNSMNWENHNTGFKSKKLETSVSLFNRWFSTRLLLTNVTGKQFLIQDSVPNGSLSATQVTADGHNGARLTVTSKCFEQIDIRFPVITCYDEHRFIIGKLNAGNIIDLDRVSDEDYNALVRAGTFFIPKLDDTEIYRLSFNFRCGPNYLNYNSYALNYEGEKNTDVSKRISTPTISKWWLVGIPQKQSLDYIYPLLNGDIKTISTENDIRTSLSTINFTGDRSYSATNLHNNFTRPGQFYNNTMSSSYINKNTDIDMLISHVELAAAGDSRCNIGTVWASGYNIVPSGYMDFSNQLFTTIFNETPITNGIVPNGNYSIFFIVEDVLGHRTAVDLIDYNNNGYAPAISDFLY